MKQREYRRITELSVMSDIPFIFVNIDHSLKV